MRSIETNAALETERHATWGAAAYRFDIVSAFRERPEQPDEFTSLVGARLTGATD
jgi:hypothetical protein